MILSSGIFQKHPIECFMYMITLKDNSALNYKNGGEILGWNIDNPSLPITALQPKRNLVNMILTPLWSFCLSQLIPA